MQRFRKILVSVDAPSVETAPHSLLRAVKLAKATGAELRVVNVVQPPSPFVRRLFRGSADAQSQIGAERERYLNELCKVLDYSRVSTKILHGRPFVELIREVEDQGCDLLIRNASGSKNSHLFFGSLDMRLMRNCPCPVWIVKPGPILSFQRVLVAVDPFLTDDHEANLNRRILDLASSLAEWEHSSLHVVAAWDVEGEALLVSKMSPDVFQEYVDEIVATGWDNVRRAVVELANPPQREQIRYRQGIPADVITQYASEISADVIVMGTLSRLGVPGMLMGNTAERVMRSARCAVLTLKPSGFVSPALTDHADAAESNGDTCKR